MVPDHNAAHERSVAALERWRSEVAKDTLGLQEVAELLDPQHPDPARVEQLVESGELFAVQHQGSRRFPRYQFSGPAVRDVIPELLALAKRNGIPSWDLALWMISGSSLFAAQDCPTDHLEDPEQLLAAARITLRRCGSKGADLRRDLCWGFQGRRRNVDCTGRPEA